MQEIQGRIVFDHLQKTGCQRVLEIGTAHGVSASYMAAAIAPRDGRVTTLDHAEATKLRDPAPGDVLARAGVTPFVDRVLVGDSSYTWWLGDKIREQTRKGRCEPLYDFVYVDGAHNWTIDGFSFFLVEKLLQPGGWILFDDLGWSYGSSAVSFGPGQSPDALGLSPAERSEPHVARVFELLVTQHAAFSNFIIQGDEWGWAQKVTDGRRTLQRVPLASAQTRLRAALRSKLA